ncbi:MAG: hypothetical protein Q9183_005371, partial [Haloplaca sp. 2 TL-2023]
MRHYQYSPLDPQSRTTRLVTVHPGSFNEDLHLSLRIVNVDETNYEALSYTWGSTDSPGVVYVGHHPSSSSEPSDYLEVTHNLELALRYLRSEETPRDIWIDAICIDQENPEERGEQVLKMGVIYQNAFRVLIWLGEAGDDGALALTSLRYLSSWVKIDWQRNQVTSMFDGETDLSRHEVELPFDQEQWWSILTFFHRPWFHRLWIWQEVLLAKSASLHCGYDTFEWSDFRKAIIGLRYKHLPKDMSTEWKGPYIEAFSHIHVLTCRRPFEGTLVAWIEGTERCRYSDPRDRIYALLHIMSRADSLVGIRPNYRETPLCVYQEVILLELDRRRDLNLLRFCELNNGSTGLKPSWVPDWSNPKASIVQRHGKANFGTKARARYLGEGLLHVTAILAAEISSIQDHFIQRPRYSTRFERLEVINAFTRLKKDRIRLSLPEVEEAQLVEAFCRTLCMNLFAD